MAEGVFCRVVASRRDERAVLGQRLIGENAAGFFFFQPVCLNRQNIKNRAQRNKKNKREGSKTRRNVSNFLRVFGLSRSKNLMTPSAR